MKKRHICAVFSLSIFCFVIFALRNRCVSSANEYWFGVESWFVVGCFIADLSMVVSLLMNISSSVNVFMKGDSEEWRSGWVGLIGWGDGWVLAEGVPTRARMRALVLGVLFFCCHKCHSGWNWKYFITKKTTYRFAENNVSFYRKHRIVLWKTTCRFWLEVEKLFWGWCFGEFWGWSSSVKVWQCGMLFLKPI